MLLSSNHFLICCTKKQEKGKNEAEVGPFNKCTYDDNQVFMHQTQVAFNNGFNNAHGPSRNPTVCRSYT